MKWLTPLFKDFALQENPTGGSALSQYLDVKMQVRLTNKNRTQATDGTNLIQKIDVYILLVLSLR